jgi:hypothetical protein
MSEANGQRASELAAQQVEQIVSAAQAAADGIREEAIAERRGISAAAERRAELMLDEARRTCQEELKEARKEAIMLEQDARRDAEGILDDAEKNAAQIREKTRRAVDGRVASAERAAAEVLEEARALSGGLRQLGKALESHADRILRDVTAAHKRMQSDLRVGGGPPEGGASDRLGPRGAADPSPAEEPSSPQRSRPEADSEHVKTGRSKRSNPFEEIDVPTWVGRET